MIPSRDVCFESWAAAYSLWEKNFDKTSSLVYFIYHVPYFRMEDQGTLRQSMSNQTDMEKKQGSVKIVSPWIPALYEIN